MINTHNVEWSNKERKKALLVLEKITKSVQSNGLPPDIFEAMARAKKNISTEIIVLNQKNEIYLIQRPSLDENPFEPYPNQWHSPGVTHNALESNQQSFERVVKEELGDVGIIKKYEAGINEFQDPPRSRYLGFVNIVLVEGEPNASDRGKFFKIDKIPWTELIGSHREIVVPRALERARELGWIY